MVPPPRGMSSGLVSPEEENDEVEDMVADEQRRGWRNGEPNPSEEIHECGCSLERRALTGTCKTTDHISVQTLLRDHNNTSNKNGFQTWTMEEGEKLQITTTQHKNI